MLLARMCLVLYFHLEIHPGHLPALTPLIFVGCLYDIRAGHCEESCKGARTSKRYLGVGHVLLRSNTLGSWYSVGLSMVSFLVWL
jgi:hypothetical protein